MATVGSLLVVLRADTSPFATAFKSANGFVEKFSNSFTGRMIGSAAIVSTLDRAVDALADSLESMSRTGVSGLEALVDASEAFVRSLESIPVAGGMGRMLAVGFDAIMPGQSDADRARNNAAVDAMLARTKAIEAEAQRKVNAEIAEGVRLTESLLTPQEQHAAFLQRANELYDAGRISIDTYNRALGDGRPLAEAARSLAESQSLAKQFFQMTRTPLEVYESTIGRLNDLLGEGLISWETYGRAVRDARSQLETIVTVQTKQSGLMAIGGPSDFSTGIRDTSSFSSRNVVDRTQEQMKDNSKKQLDLSAEQIEQLKRIDQSVRDGHLIIDEVNI